MLNYGTVDTFFDSLATYANLDKLKEDFRKLDGPVLSNLEEDVEIEEKYLEHLLHSNKQIQRNKQLAKNK